jgi:hypothetical protein
MSDESRGDGAVLIAGVLLFLCVFGGGGAVAWFGLSQQRLAMEQAMVAEQRARAAAEVARAEAIRASIAAAQSVESKPDGSEISETSDRQIETAENQPVLGPLRWLVGSWLAVQGKRTTEEVWMAPRVGVMIGVNRSTGGTQKPFYEYLRIESTDDGIVYFASPLGKSETAFPLRQMSDQEVVFENLDHDFPQRIIYTRAGDQLQTRVEGSRDDGQPRSLQWQFLLQ